MARQKLSIKKEEGRRKKEEVINKEGRRKKEEGRRKKEEGSIGNERNWVFLPDMFNDN
jgi:hypothetical protein